MAGIAVSVALSRLLPPPYPSIGLAGWWALELLVTTAVIGAATIAMRRVLPLAILLDMSLVFPDHVPSRLAIARRRPNSKTLQADLQRAAAEGRHDSATERAELILTLALSLSAHDASTRGHSERVRVVTEMLADELKITGPDRDRLRWAALLHDIGKLTVPAEVLNKPGRPDEREWEILRRHPEEGARLVASMMPYFGVELGGAVGQHHERYDGSGYPRGLVGEAISMGGRIVAVADSYEVMTTARAYKKPMTPQAARAELVRCSGKDFDPDIVRACLNISLGKLWRAAGFSTLVAQLPGMGRVPGLLAQATAPVAAVPAAALAVAALTVLGAYTPASATAPVVAGCPPQPVTLYQADAPAVPHDPSVVATVAVGRGPANMVMDPQSGRLFVAIVAENRIAVVDGRASPPRTTGSIPVGANPFGMDLDPVTGRLYVAGSGSCALYVIDARALTPYVIDTVSVGHNPAAVAVDGQTGRVFVANAASNSVDVIDGRAQTPGRLATVAMGSSPTVLAVAPGNGRVLVGSFASSRVSLLDGRSSPPRRLSSELAVSGPNGFAFNASGDTAYVSENQLADSLGEIRGLAGSPVLTGVARVSRNPIRVAILADRLYVACYGQAANGTQQDPHPPGALVIIDRLTFRVLKTIEVANALGVVADPSSGRIFVSERHSGVVLVLRASQ
ncbi:MAG TPA: HD domain-containing phosphohydrolase [Candidatus Solibacter sp.]|nr:HD domain-containing phosphohydrolase [Candidatus Solibacter sp.]